MKIGVSVWLAASALASGCATVTSSEMQTLSLRASSSDDQVIEQAKCSLHNDKGTWELVAPGYVSVHRSAGDLMVECKKDGMPDGYLRVISRVAGGMFGNILFGGAIGALIDHSKGTGYNYPDALHVKMGSSSTADRRDENKKPQQPAQQAAISGLQNSN